MASFALLNEEKKIQRRKEKEKERKAKMEERIKQAPTVGKWADASDEEDEDDKLFRPVSDTESEDEDTQEEEPAQPGGVAKEPAPSPPPKAAEKEAPKAEAPPAGKSKKERKKEKPPVDEDIDDVLAEFGIDLGDATQQSAGGNSKRKKKKEKEAQAAETAPVPEKDSPKENTACEQKDPVPDSEESKNGKQEPADDEAEIDEAARQAALEALKRKQASKGKKATPDAAKYAAAEAKKRAQAHKAKKDKSMYDR